VDEQGLQLVDIEDTDDEVDDVELRIIQNVVDEMISAVEQSERDGLKLDNVKFPRDVFSDWEESDDEASDFSSSLAGFFNTDPTDLKQCGIDQEVESAMVDEVDRSICHVMLCYINCLTICVH
jgi:hypothetical protein